MEVPRRRADIASILAALTVCINLGTAVWWVAKVDAVITQLQVVTAELKTSSQQGSTLLHNHESRIRLLELQRTQDDRWSERLEEVLRQKGIY